VFLEFEDPRSRSQLHCKRPEKHSLTTGRFFQSRTGFIKKTKNQQVFNAFSTPAGQIRSMVKLFGRHFTCLHFERFKCLILNLHHHILPSFFISFQQAHGQNIARHGNSGYDAFFNNIYSAIVSKYNNFIKHQETKRGLFSAYSLCSLFYCRRLFELCLNIYLIKK
jgi:hypothetical protein